MSTDLSIRIGSDPEFFIRRGLHILSAHNYPAGTKASPMPTKHGSIQVDGTALECNVRPAQSRNEFVKNVRGVLGDMTTFLHRYEPKATVVAQPSVYFGRRRLSTFPGTAAVLGCTPDWNAYTGKKNEQPDANHPFRTGAGHIHVSWGAEKDVTSKAHFEECSEIVQELDYYLGLPSLLWDNDVRRRRLYGRAGAFRPKTYGLEYRVLSNAWITTDKQIGWVFDQTVRAVTKVLTGKAWLSRNFRTLAKTSIDDNMMNWDKAWPAIASEVLQ